MVEGISDLARPILDAVQRDDIACRAVLTHDGVEALSSDENKEPYGVPLSLRVSATGRTRYWMYPRGFLSAHSLSSCAFHSACSRVSKRATSRVPKNITATTL